jgi:S1-C subfamily serine protease
VKWVVMQLLRDGRVRRGYLGIAGANVPLPRRIARHFGLANTRTVRVESLEAGGPASRAGIEPGDFIVAFDGLGVDDIDSLHRLLTIERIGKPLGITVLRGTQKLDLRIISVETAPFGRARE